VLKATARILAGLVIVLTGLSAVSSFAGPPPSAIDAALVATVLGQTSSPDKKAQADDLLRRARQAMADNDLPGAEQLIASAEALGVNYGPLNFGDTPEKARRDLDERRQSAAGSPSRPGNTFGLPFRKKTDVSDPFAARSGGLATEPPATGRDSRDERITMLPPVNQVNPVRPPAPPAPLGRPVAESQPTDADGSEPPSQAAGPDRAKSDELLIAARRALALGDVRRASGMLEQTRTLNVRYGFHDDSPAKVEASLRQFEDLMGQPADRRDSEGYRRQYAKLLMEQSQSLMQWRQYDEAERLAVQASRQQVNYGPFDQKPEALLRQIDAVRRQNGPAGPLAAGGATARTAPSMAAKQKAMEMVHYARQALAAGDLVQAENLARQAELMQIPDSAFGPGEDSPGRLLAEIRSLRLRGNSGVMPASGQYPVNPATGRFDPDQRASRAIYDPRSDTTRNVQATGEQPYPGEQGLAQNAPAPVPPADAAAPIPGGGMALFQRGEAALRARDVPAAMQYFRQAAAYRNDLDPQTAQRLQEYLQMPSVGRGSPAPSMIDEAAARQQALVRQVRADVVHQESSAAKLRETDPKGALALLEDTRKKVEAAGIDSTARDQLLRGIDRNIEQTKKYLSENRPRIELEEQNKRVQGDVDRKRMMKLEVQEKMALLVDEFNRLMDEQRFAEAEVVAKQAMELDPENPVVQQLALQSKFVRRYFNNLALQNDREQAFINVMDDVEQAAVQRVGDRNPMIFPDAREWERLTQSRSRLLADKRRGRSEREMEIEQKLRTPVTLQFKDAPLSTVMEYLAKLADVNLHLDPQGLAQEGVTTDTPVTITLGREISLKSALNLILQPLHLSYVIKDEVLKVTSEQLRDGEVYTVTYSVADLVIPIPNFVPNPRMGLAGAYHDALGSIGFGGNMAFGGGSSPLAVVASRDGNKNSARISDTVLAQAQASGGPVAGGTRNSPMGFGPGGLGGGAQADFDSLIDLITSTIKPTTWDAVGGPGSIAPFETNLSIVVSQTQDVHEEIVDLLEQLRRLQDLQVTIEVRFITLNDNFFERIGVDFDFDINDNADHKFQIFGSQNPQISTQYTNQTVGSDYPRNTLDRDLKGNQSVAVGLSAPGTFSADLDIPVSQGSYGLAVPQFGGYTASNNPGMTMGFAILSQIEAYFFIEAAQGDVRTNVLQAPKVTLFNGQQAFVSDTSQSPFVISVIPVVGDFAAAQQPVIVVLNEGTFLTVQAVVSNDRRFVRLTVVPFFSKIDKVNTFQFTGSTTTSTDSSTQGNQTTPDANTRKDESSTVTTEGTTVQLPTFSFVTVTTTVSVPDGGTVLLGGIKRLSEDREEYGVPILNKIPYLNRLFNNVGVGRSTSSLMMMVTPRIIIQEEEEERLGVQP
jgi:general secretion pathway protein D